MVLFQPVVHKIFVTLFLIKRPQRAILHWPLKIAKL